MNNKHKTHTRSELARLKRVFNRLKAATKDFTCGDVWNEQTGEFELVCEALNKMEVLAIMNDDELYWDRGFRHLIDDEIEAFEQKQKAKDKHEQQKIELKRMAELAGIRDGAADAAKDKVEQMADRQLKKALGEQNEQTATNRFGQGKTTKTKR